MRRTVLATLTALTAIGMLPNASAQSNTYAVDCNRGQKIAVALDQGDFRKPLVITLRGTCREFVTITRANVTLRGTPDAEIVAPDDEHDLLTVSADKVTLENLTLTGGLTGIAQEHEPTFIARKVVVQDTSGVGVRVRFGDARLIDCTVQRSGGVGIDTNESTIAENAGNGIDLLMSQAHISGGDTIRSNGITLVWGAKLILEEPATKVSGSYYALFCADNESSYTAMAPLNTTDLVTCTDFNH